LILGKTLKVIDYSLLITNGAVPVLPVLGKEGNSSWGPLVSVRAEVSVFIMSLEQGSLANGESSINISTCGYVCIYNEFLIYFFNSKMK
jgi:hypothetical protein